MANFQKIKDIAKEKGIELRDIADQIGITATGLTLIMKNNSTNTKTIEAIARVLNVPVGVLFDESCNAQNDGVVLSHEVVAMLREKDERIKELTDTIIRMR